MIPEGAKTVDKPESPKYKVVNIPSTALYASFDKTTRALPTDFQQKKRSMPPLDKRNYLNIPRKPLTPYEPPQLGNVELPKTFSMEDFVKESG